MRGILVRLVTFPYKLFLDATDSLSRRGSWSLRPYELQLFEVGFQSLTDSEREIARAQLKDLFYIQRLHDDRMNDIYFYFPEWVPRLDRPENFQLAKLRLRAGRRRVDVQVETFDGYVRALRFKKPPQPVVSQDFQIEILELGGTNDDTIANEIDFEEHGGQHEWLLGLRTMHRVDDTQNARRRSFHFPIYGRYGGWKNLYVRHL